MNVQLDESRSMSSVCRERHRGEWAVSWGYVSKKPPQRRTNPIPLCTEYVVLIPRRLSPDSGVTLVPAPSMLTDGSYVCVPLTVMFPLGPNFVASYLVRC